MEGQHRGAVYCRPRRTRAHTTLIDRPGNLGGKTNFVIIVQLIWIKKGELRCAYLAKNMELFMGRIQNQLFDSIREMFRKIGKKPTWSN